MSLHIKDRSFTDDQGRTLDFLLMDGADPMTCIYDFEVEFSVSFSNSIAATKSNAINDELTLTTGEWEDFGFVEGAGISGNYIDPGGSSQSIPGGTTIDFIDGPFIRLSASIPGPDGTITSGKFVCDAAPEGVNFFFNLVQNSGPESPQSLVDNEQQRFEVEIPSGMTVGTTVAFDQLGNHSGGSSMFPTLTRLADDGTKKNYRIFTQFKGWLVGAEMRDQYFGGGNAVKPWIRLEIIPQFQNPGIKISTTHAPDAANTGHFDEVYNGGLPPYACTEMIWEDDDGNILQDFDHTKPNVFTVRYDGVFTAASKSNICFFWDPIDESFYKNQPNSMEFNRAMIISLSAIDIGGPIAISGHARPDGARVDLENFEFIQFGTYAIFTGRIVPNSAFSSFIESQPADPSLVNSNRRYRFAFKLQDPSLTDNFIKASWVTADYGEMTRDMRALGPWEDGVTIQMFDHVKEVTTTTITEDDLLFKGRFRIPKSNSDFTGFALKFLAVKDDGEQFTLDSFSVNLFDYPQLPDGTRPVNTTQAQPFRLPPLSEKREISIFRDVTIDNVPGYGIGFEFGQLMRWQYWIAQLNASLDFFGTNGEGKNQNWQHYQNADWTLYFALEIQSLDGSYENRIPMPILDYDVWTGISDIRFELIDGTPITQPILGEVVRVIAQHTLNNPEEWRTLPWGQITVEPFEGPANSRPMSSTYLPTAPDPSNPLQPENGQVGLRRVMIGTDTVEFSCLFDASQIDISRGISFTSRVEGQIDGGIVRRNRTKETFGVSVKPIMITEENRGWDECCDPFLTLANPDSLNSWENDQNSAWEKGDTVTFELRRYDGTLATTQPAAIAFPNEPNAFYCTINWRNVFVEAEDGPGCYRLFVISEYAGLTASKLWGEYALAKYETDPNNAKIAPQLKTVRIMSVFNDNNTLYGINFTGAKVVDTIRFKGRFGYFNPNTQVDNVEYTDGAMQKVRRENLTNYTLRVDLAGHKIVERLVNDHFLAENACWISDHNPDNYKYYLDFPVIFTEAVEPEHFPGTRMVKIGAKYEGKVRRSKTHWLENNPAAADIFPPAIQASTALVINSAVPPTFSASFSTSSPYILPNTDVNVYEMVAGVPVLVDTFTYPTLEPLTELTIDL